MVSSLHVADLPAICGGKPVRSDFLHLAKPRLSETEISALVDTVRSGWLTTGARTAEFENTFKTYVGTRNAVALNSCTAGLFLSLKVLGIGPGDEVIAPSFTFVATANAIEHTGAKPVFADIDPASWCIDPEDVKRKITRSTRAVMPVHIFGMPCDMDALMNLARNSGLHVVQDCAHAIESSWRGRSPASFGDLACYSFYATKNVTTGEGGMVATDNDAWAERLRTLALHGLSKSAYQRYAAGGQSTYNVQEPGYKYNMPDTAAALGLEGLRLVEERLSRRKELWDRYAAGLSGVPGISLPPAEQAGTRHARHIFACVIEPEKAGLNRDLMIEALKAENIGTGIHFIPVHSFDYYRNKYGLSSSDLPHTSWLGERVFSLPLTPYLTDSDVDDVIRAVRKIVAYYTRHPAI